MNQQQKTYAIQRVRDIQSTKVKAATAKFTTDKKELSGDEKVELIKAGKVKLRATSVDQHTNLGRAFDFSKYERPPKYDGEKANPLIDKINTSATKIIDDIMIGDADEALKAIRDFEKE